MKKIILSSFLFLGVVYCTEAQLTVGAKLGINVANQNVDTNFSPDPLLRPHFGVFAVIAISDKIGFQPELLISGKGSKFNGFKTKLTYVDVPLLARYSFNEMFSVQAGPQLSVLVIAKDDNGDDIKDFYKSTDLGFAVGGQVDFPFGMVAGLRYIAGLSDVNDSGGAKVQSRVFQVYVGWRFIGD